MKPIDQFDLVKCLQTPKFEGAAAIPVDSNGEPIFQALWQVQIFATVIFLTEKGVLRLEDFRARFTWEIEAAIRDVNALKTDLASNYYQIWLVTLEALLIEKGICLQVELDTEQPESLLV